MDLEKLTTALEKTAIADLAIGILDMLEKTAREHPRHERPIYPVSATAWEPLHDFMLFIVRQQLLTVSKVIGEDDDDSMAARIRRIKHAIDISAYGLIMQAHCKLLATSHTADARGHCERMRQEIRKALEESICDTEDGDENPGTAH